MSHSAMAFDFDGGVVYGGSSMRVACLTDHQILHPVPWRGSAFPDCGFAYEEWQGRVLGASRRSVLGQDGKGDEGCVRGVSRDGL
jgi:hypothetical protein